MDDVKKAQQSLGAASAGVKQQISETAADVKQKVTDLGRGAADQFSGVVQSTTEKVRAAAEYFDQTEFKAMAEDVREMVRRYPGRSLVAAAVVGFLIAHWSRKD